MKGPVLARRLGVELHRRGWMIDNDVLVRRRDAERAVSVLRGLGYAPTPFVELESQLRVNFEAALRCQRGGVPLWAEVHWAPFPWPLYPAREDLVWRHTELVEVLGRQVRVFDPPLTIVHLASHFVQHLAMEPRILSDLSWAWNAWQADVSRVDLRALAEAFRLHHVVAYALHIAGERGVLDAPPPFDTPRARLLRRLVSADDVDEQRPRHDYPRMIAMSLAAPPQRVPRWLWNTVAPPIDVMASIYDQPVTPTLYLRYFTRLFRPLGRRLGWVR